MDPAKARRITRIENEKPDKRAHLTNLQQQQVVRIRKEPVVNLAGRQMALMGTITNRIGKLGKNRYPSLPLNEKRKRHPPLIYPCSLKGVPR